MTEASRNYVAAWVDWGADKIVVLERDTNGKLYRKRYNPPYYFYIPDDEGEYESIFGHKLTRAEFASRDEYEIAKKHFPGRWDKFESDIQPLKRVLMDNYYDVSAPLVHAAFLDIEVDYSQKIGFASPANPYAPISAITIYQTWTGKYLTYAVPPAEFEGTVVDIQNLIGELSKKNQLREGITPRITLCQDELELLHRMLDDLQDADIVSGWNSEFFDIPYICKRLELAGGQPLLARLDHVGTKLPKEEKVMRFGTEEIIYKLSGRSHLDYLRLFKKFTFEGRTSYALGNILQEEVGIGKLDYEGTLEQVYHKDFPTFVAYNFRDVDGLVQLDNKFKFIALTNQMAHENTVLFDAILGTVSYVETGIANHAHYKLDKIVHDKFIEEHDKVEGAIVLTPTPSLYEWIGSVDLKSLYPNTIRSLNISPEMIVGQFTAKEEAWKDIRLGASTRHTLILESGEQHIATAAEWKKVLSEQKWAVSAYGTVFDQGKGVGVVADILGYWYSERKRLQAEQKKWAKKVEQLPKGLEQEEAKRQEEYYDLLQLTKKISMNSLYGALLNVAFRFGDERMGASVTATGRAITTHMLYTIEELITGVPKKYAKVAGVEEESGSGDTFNRWLYITQRSQLESLRAAKKLANPSQQLPDDFVDFESVIYGDTDSCYFRTMATDKEAAVEIADTITSLTNKSFPPFMREAFNCQTGFDDLISAGREIVGVRGLFQAKKKYMIKVVDKEGFTPKPGKDLKTQGSEIKKADTPKIIQAFLKKTVDMILDGESYDSVSKFILAQRKEILKSKENLFMIGVSKQVNNLDSFMAEYANPGTILSGGGRKLAIPGHVRAALNYNHLINVFDRGARPIRAGDKATVFYVKPNQFKFKSVAFPAEFSKFPKWFTENFVVDVKLTEDKMFDNKLRGIFSALRKEVPTPQTVLTNSILEF